MYRGMMSNALIQREYNNVQIMQRKADRYLDATAMCQAAGKMWGHYWSTQNAQEYASELGWSIGIPIDQLVSTRMDGPNNERGTWVHPRIAIHLAQWCSAKFAVAVSGWVEELMTTGSVSLQPMTTLQMLAAQCQAMVQLEESITTVKGDLGNVKSQVAALIETRDQAVKELTGVERSDIPAEPKTVRAKINELARTYAMANGIEYAEVFKTLYHELKYRYSFDVMARRRKSKKNCLAIVEENGKLDELFAIASEILK